MAARLGRSGDTGGPVREPQIRDPSAGVVGSAFPSHLEAQAQNVRPGSLLQMETHPWSPWPCVSHTWTDGGHFAVALRPRCLGQTMARPPTQVAACQSPPASPGIPASVCCTRGGSHASGDARASGAEGRCRLRHARRPAGGGGVGETGRRRRVAQRTREFLSFPFFKLK